VNFYKRNIGDYLKKTAHLSLLEHGVYNRLLDVYYTREDGVPKDQAARLVGARTKEEKQALESVLNEFFQCFDGVWRQDRCDEEIAHVNAKAERNREVGKTGGRPRKNGNGSEPTNNPDGYFPKPKNNPTPDSRLQDSKTPESETDTALTRDACADGFEEIRSAYPKRAGDQRWQQAEKTYRRRIKAGQDHEEILAAVRRYASCMQAKGSEGSEFVKQAATFLNSDECLAKDWSAPPTRGQQRQDRNISASLQWLAEQEANDASH